MAPGEIAIPFIPVQGLVDTSGLDQSAYRYMAGPPPETKKVHGHELINRKMIFPAAYPGWTVLPSW